MRLLTRDARSSPSAISFRIVELAHWSLALTCATESSFETGIISVLGFDFQGEPDGQNIARGLCC